MQTPDVASEDHQPRTAELYSNREEHSRSLSGFHGEEVGDMLGKEDDEAVVM